MPLPFGVTATGAPVRRTSSSSRARPFRPRAPAPAKISGRSARNNIAIARAHAAPSTRKPSSARPKGTDERTPALATSSGNDTNAAPGRPLVIVTIV
ncbi:hypothetical protein [Nannocystis pusilla]|uniref:hypothetical protein n=1 Tax=Nannocystis pusilla TaxID=889268 RepID=UPI003DA4A3E6